MFLIDKYRPDKRENIFFHKELIELLSKMSSDEAIPHIIFYGPEGSGKKTIIRLFLEMLFDSSVHKTSDVPYKVSGSGSKNTIEKIKQSNYHIVIDPKNNNYDRYLIHDIVKEYAKRKTLGAYKTNRSFKVVSINNLDNMSYYAQTALRRTMERYNDKCRFVMWCKSLSKVIKPLQSRCVCIRVSAPSDDDLFKYVLRISAKEHVMLSSKQYTGIVIHANGDIKKALWELEFYKHGYKIDTDYYESLVKIMDLVVEPKISNMITIRNIIFNLMITNFDGTTIMRDLIEYICMNKRIKDLAKQKIIHESAEIEYQLVKGRREIFHFDNMISSIMTILHNQDGLKNDTKDDKYS